MSGGGIARQGAFGNFRRNQQRNPALCREFRTAGKKRQGFPLCTEQGFAPGNRIAPQPDQNPFHMPGRRKAHGRQCIQMYPEQRQRPDGKTGAKRNTENPLPEARARIFSAADGRDQTQRQKQHAEHCRRENRKRFRAEENQNKNRCRSRRINRRHTGSGTRSCIQKTVLPVFSYHFSLASASREACFTDSG